MNPDFAQFVEKRQSGADENTNTSHMQNKFKTTPPLDSEFSWVGRPTAGAPLLGCSDPVIGRGYELGKSATVEKIRKIEGGMQIEKKVGVNVAT